MRRYAAGLRGKRSALLHRRSVEAEVQVRLDRLVKGFPGPAASAVPSKIPAGTADSPGFSYSTIIQAHCSGDSGYGAPFYGIEIYLLQQIPRKQRYNQAGKTG
ncbi:hypothetical protein AMQ84_21375 [Paenibacillus riograndensis]|uniref:Uncharacterized protein n=1 Tax=Paenibacillus riograndensis TaxID=483937 RepID=A0A132TS15_9BACL|nr:hypothetical protein [Paenibacillus riograndensis]KWX74122.1 hypothetical protein AMQ84_21375 [Paenibacillus riograndensis]